jgi:NAD(P)-dependent dehydrogenase (short-subunit alcohol dehydrogenase family)
VTDPRQEANPIVFELEVKGWLDPEMAAHVFPGMTLRRGDSGRMILRGPLPDQAALYGVLNRLRNLGLPILTLQAVEHGGLPTPQPESTSKGEPMTQQEIPQIPAYPAGEAVLVTGCSSGIGQAIALHLAIRSFTVLATVRREADAERLRSFRLPGLEPVCPVDLAKPGDLPAICGSIREALSRRGLDRLYAVVNNAGGGFIAPVELMDRARFRAEMEIRVHSPLALLQDLLPLLRNARGSRILWISTPALIAIPFVASIHACEFALNGLAQSLRMELAPWRIPNIVIGCGGIQTAAPARTERELEQSLRAWPAAKAGLYAGSLDRLRVRLSRFDSGRTPPEAVARVVCDALTAAHPRRKYYAGHLAWVMDLLRFLPASVVERALMP